MTSLTHVIAAVAATLAACAPVASATPSASIHGDGTYMVGSDIAPGRYFSPGGVDDGDCYWERLSALDDSGDFSNIIQNSLSSGPQYVDIKASDMAFKTQLCKPWVQRG
jgi:hypothetical protein